METGSRNVRQGMDGHTAQNILPWVSNSTQWLEVSTHAHSKNGLTRPPGRNFPQTETQIQPPALAVIFLHHFPQR